MLQPTLCISQRCVLRASRFRVVTRTRRGDETPFCPPPAFMAVAQLSRPAPQAVRCGPPARGAAPARVAAPQRSPVRFSRLVAAARRGEDNGFDSVFTSRSDAALAYVCVDCGCAGASLRALGAAHARPPQRSDFVCGSRATRRPRPAPLSAADAPRRGPAAQLHLYRLTAFREAAVELQVSVVQGAQELVCAEGRLRRERAPACVGRRRRARSRRRVRRAAALRHRPPPGGGPRFGGAPRAGAGAFAIYTRTVLLSTPGGTVLALRVRGAATASRRHVSSWRARATHAPPLLALCRTARESWLRCR